NQNIGLARRDLLKRPRLLRDRKTNQPLCPTAARFRFRAPRSALRAHLIHAEARDAKTLGRLEAECLAVKIQVEPARCSLPAADTVKRKLFGQIAVRFGLKTVAQPVFAFDRDIRQGRPQIKEWHIKTASIEGYDGFI